jgi:Skp family chaperone for outer membrane proteins
MQNVRFLQLGWVLALAFVGVALAGGFGAQAEKTGVVDISKVVEQSDFGKANQDAFTVMRTAREGLLEFIDTYRVLTPEQATQIRDLSLKTNATDQEKAALEVTKSAVVNASKRWAELATKQGNLTAEERTLMEDYAKRSSQMNETAQRWFKEFTNEMQTWADKQKLVSIEKARGAIQEVAKAQGFTVIFEVGVAPYGANDITDQALQAMNAKK